MRRAMTSERYSVLLTYFRDNGRNITGAAKAAGVARGTALRAWARGWPEQGFPGVGQALEDEATRIRAELEAQAQAKLRQDADAKATSDARLKNESDEARKREQAKSDAVMIGVDEVRVVRATQQNAMAGLAAVNAAAGAIFKQLVSYRAHVEKIPAAELEKLNADPKYVDRVHKNAQMISGMSHHIAQVSKITMEMERMRVGKPVAIIGVELTDKTQAQIERELEAALADLRAAAAAGLVLPDGEPVTIPPPGTTIQ